MRLMMLLSLILWPAVASAQAGRGVPAPPPRLDDLVKRWEQEKTQPYAQRFPTLNEFGQVRSDASADFVAAISRDDADPNIRRMAIGILGTIGQPKSAPYLEVVARQGAEDLRANALSSLSRLRPLPDRKVFAELAAPSNSQAVRMAAIRGLGEYQDLEAVKILVALLAEPPKERDAAGQAIEGALLAELRELRLKEGRDYIVQEVLRRPAGEELRRKRLLAAIVATPDPSPYLEVFLALLKEKDDALRAEAVHGLEGRPLAEAAIEALVRLIEDKQEAVAIGAAAILGRAGPEPALKPLIKASAQKPVGPAAAATEALGAFPRDEGAMKHLVKSLERKKDWPVVAAAIAGLARRRAKDAVSALVDALPRLDGRLLSDAVRALQRMTGQDLDSAKDWKSWWQTVKDSFVFEAPRKEEPARKGGVSSVTRNPTYYGTEVVSRRIAFVVDFSGSMSAKMNPSDPKSPSRIEQAKAELVQVIKALPKGAYFNLVFFGTAFKAWRPTIIKADEKTSAEALAHIEKTGLMGGTNIFDPLDATLQDPNVDTIYLLSDGAPGVGKFTRPEDILREIKKVNAGRKVVIHCISFGMKSAFMKDLAEQNGGSLIER